MWALGSRVSPKFVQHYFHISLVFGIVGFRNVDMATKDGNTLSPTVIKVLDEYLAALIADEEIDHDAAKRLDALLRQGKVPKSEDMQVALDPSQKEEK